MGIEKNQNLSVAIRGRNRYPNDIIRNRNCNYVHASMYSLHLDRIFERFPKERVMIINYEALKSHPKQISIEIFKFMGLPYKNILINTDKIVNPGVKAHFPKLNSILILKNSWINKIWHKVPINLRVKVMTSFLKLNTQKEINRESISVHDWLYLKQIFKEGLNKLENKYGITFNS